MGRAYRDNLKNQYGKPDVTARDVIALGGTVSAGSAALTDAQGLAAHPAVRAGRLEGASIVSSSGLATGTLSLALKVNGATAASGDLTAGGVAYLDLLLNKEDGDAVALDAGDSVALIYNAVGVGAAPTLSARVHQSLLE